MRWVLLGVMLAAGCQWSTPAQPPPEPVPAPTPEPLPEQTVDVEHEVCEQWRSLNCEEGIATPGGESCEDVLRNAAREGIDLTPPIGCMRRARNCGEMRECEQQ